MPAIAARARPICRGGANGHSSGVGALLVARVAQEV